MKTELLIFFFCNIYTEHILFLHSRLPYYYFLWTGHNLETDPDSISPSIFESTSPPLPIFLPNPSYSFFFHVNIPCITLLLLLCSFSHKFLFHGFHYLLLRTSPSLPFLFFSLKNQSAPLHLLFPRSFSFSLQKSARRMDCLRPSCSPLKTCSSCSVLVLQLTQILILCGGSRGCK